MPRQVKQAAWASSELCWRANRWTCSGKQNKATSKVKLQAVKRGSLKCGSGSKNFATDGKIAGAEAWMPNHQRPHFSEPKLLQPV